MAHIVDPNNASDILKIDATSKAARVSLYENASTTALDKTIGAAVNPTDKGIAILGVNDGEYRVMRVDRFGSTALARNQFLLSEPFDNTAINPNRWTAASTTFAPALTVAGGYSMNGTSVVTAAAATLLRSNRYLARPQRAPMQIKIRARALHQANMVMEFGCGLPASQTVSPLSGAFFQINATGVVQGVVATNSSYRYVEMTTMPANWQDNYYIWDIIIDDDNVNFYVQDGETNDVVASGSIDVLRTTSRMIENYRLPVFARCHNVTAPAQFGNLIVTGFDVVQLDTDLMLSTSALQAFNAHDGASNPLTGAQIANWTNSTAPVSATLSNTAAGYTTLGGNFQFAATAGAITDYALFGFTVPAPYSFVCTGITIDALNTGAAVATTPSVLQWFLSPDQTAISLVTASNRRVPLGIQSFPIGSVIGATPDKSIDRDFANAPLVTSAGRILVVGLRLPIGTATASQIIQGTVAVKGYFI